MPWFIKTKHGERGPLPTTKLKELVEAGKLSEDVMIRRDGQSQWVQAGAVAGLFPESAPPKAEAPEATAPQRRTLSKSVKSVGRIASSIAGMFKRESKAEKQAKLAAIEAKRLAKENAWRRFWFHVKLMVFGVVLGCFLLIGFLVYLVSRVTPSYSRYPTYEPVAAPVYSAPPTVAPREQPFTPPDRSNKKFVESKFEKAYERAMGVEIVHKKDGSTYTRKAPKKRDHP